MTHHSYTNKTTLHYSTTPNTLQSYQQHCKNYRYITSKIQISRFCCLNMTTCSYESHKNHI